MKTIAITIDDDTLARVDRLGTGSRSKLVREAVRAYVTQLEQQAQEEREHAIVQRHRRRLAQEARALVRTQARS
jgi:metal-responsive CopG/Arc/MetJ family transcriptional regulator